jgi:hypothetical protein
MACRSCARTADKNDSTAVRALGAPVSWLPPRVEALLHAATANKMMAKRFTKMLPGNRVRT